MSRAWPSRPLREDQALNGFGGGECPEQSQQPQQTGTLFIVMQQAQPAFIMAAMQSQHA
jgi:hypothetical protein